MSLPGEVNGLSIFLLSMFVVCFGIAIVVLFLLFSRKNELNRKEKEIMRAAYDKIILQSQLEIQEQTFGVISSELHDNVGQVLSLAKVQVNIMDQKDEMDRAMLMLIRENISKALHDLRDIAKGLNSDRIRTLSIYDTVEEEIDRINRMGFLRAMLSRDGQECRLDEQKKLILFRIIQESIQNCVKHAAATELSVCFSCHEGCLKVSVRDNGRGFDQQEVLARSKGMGLGNISRRASLVGGEAFVESALNAGTSVHISIPYE